jgi:hypothetical protein
MSVVFALAAVFVYGAALGFAMTGSAARRVLLVGLGALGLAAPFVMREPPFGVRLVLTGGLAITFLRLVDLARERHPLPAARRVLHATMMMEMRRTKRVPRHLHVRGLLHMLIAGTVSALSLVGFAQLPPSGEPSSRILRLLTGIVFAYASFDTVVGVAIVLWSALGFDLPLMHNHPIKSRTVAEFWSERWNRIVGGWLRVHCFMPLARRRYARFGIAAAFAASTVLHVYLAWGVFDARAASMWGVFFGLQIPIVLTERALRVSSWPVPLARLWTVGVLCAASPFFVEPVLRAFDGLR